MIHIEPTKLCEQLRHLENRLVRAGGTREAIAEARRRLIASNPPLRHFLLNGSVACGQAMTAGEFTTKSTKDIGAATCKRCQAAAKSRATA